MFRTLAIAASFAALCTPALAKDVTVSLSGKSPEAVHKELVRASQRVCYDLYGNSIAVFAQRQCYEATLKSAKAKAAEIYAASPNDKLASR